METGPQGRKTAVFASCQPESIKKYRKLYYDIKGTLKRRGKICMKNGKKCTLKQAAALLCVIILVLLYIVTLVFACMDFPGADKLFAACLLTTIGLPILLWLCIWFYGRMKERQTDAPDA